MRRGILSAGTWCVDLNKTIDAWQQEDTATRILALERQGGGSGTNMATAIKRLDPEMPVEAMGLIGEDDDGRHLLALCDAMGIDRAQLRASSAGPTFFSDCFNAKASGKRTHFYHPGIGDILAPEHFDFAHSRARYVHLGLPGVHKAMDGPHGAHSTGWAHVLEAARKAGLKTNLEMVTAERDRVAAIGRSCLPHLDCLIVNDFEIGALAGIETRRDGRAYGPAVAEALQAVVKLGPLEIAVSHFPEGAIAATRGGALFACGSVAIPADEIAGVNGAGDSFAAGTLYGLHEGWEPARCIALGHASAAMSMREAPTTTGIRPVRQCLEAAARWGYRPSPIS